LKETVFNNVFDRIDLESVAARDPHHRDGRTQ